MAFRVPNTPLSSLAGISGGSKQASTPVDQQLLLGAYARYPVQRRTVVPESCGPDLLLTDHSLSLRVISSTCGQLAACLPLLDWSQGSLVMDTCITQAVGQLHKAFSNAVTGVHK